MSNFKKDFDIAANNFDVIAKNIKDKVRLNLINIELMDNELSKMFDKYSGIDALDNQKNQLRTVALRCQYFKAWNTFTVRYKRFNGVKTEYDKRVEAIFGDKGFLYPYLTVQTYLSEKVGGKILSCGIIKTKDLYQYFIDNISTAKIRTCPEGNQFIYEDFNTLKNHGCSIVIL